MSYESSNTLAKILSGMSKSLGIANQLIPIYQDTEPLIKNVKNLFDNQKNKSQTKKEEKFSFEEPLSSPQKEKAINNNNPNFFI